MWPRFVLPQIKGKDGHTAKKQSRKLKKSRMRGYISTGEVKILAHYFLVPKGEYIHMIYNGTSSGLNDAL